MVSYATLYSCLTKKDGEPRNGKTTSSCFLLTVSLEQPKSNKFFSCIYQQTE